MQQAKKFAAMRAPCSENELNPLQLTTMLGGRPYIDFHWKEVSGKRRLIGNPNKPMRELHKLFGQYLKKGLFVMGGDGYYLRQLPSATAFVNESNALKNAMRHQDGKFFYITDIRDAYPSVDLKRLAILIVYIKKHYEYRTSFSVIALVSNASHQDAVSRDPLFTSVHSFLKIFCGGLRGEGLAVGGPLSPYLFNLYCEAFVDARIRKLCERYSITYTRYADDLCFSRATPVVSDMRRQFREFITDAGFVVNRRKSKVLSRNMGTVFVTKMGLRDSVEEGSSATIVFPQKKRRKLHKLINDYLSMRMDWPEQVSGYIAEFLHYYKNVDVPTKSDLKTFAFCKRFEVEWKKYRLNR